MVGHQVLALGIGVRVPTSEQSVKGINGPAAVGFLFYR